MSLMEKINEDIKESMKSKNQVRLDTLRMLKSKILTVDARGNISEEEAVKLFKHYFGNLQESLDHAQAANRPEMIEKLKIEMDVVKEFLPKTLSPEETKKIVQQAIAETGTTTKKGLGLVMKSIMKINNSVDGKLAKEIASQLLPD